MFIFIFFFNYFVVLPVMVNKDFQINQTVTSFALYSPCSALELN